LLTAFRIVLELFVEEEELFSGCEDKIGPAVGAFEIFVDEFHASLAFARSTRSNSAPTNGVPGSPGIQECGYQLAATRQ
jgi:hypothetical protein